MQVWYEGQYERKLFIGRVESLEMMTSFKLQDNMKYIAALEFLLVSVPVQYEELQGHLAQCKAHQKELQSLFDACKLKFEENLAKCNYNLDQETVALVNELSMMSRPDLPKIQRTILVGAMLTLLKDTRTAFDGLMRPHATTMHTFPSPRSSSASSVGKSEESVVRVDQKPAKHQPDETAQLHLLRSTSPNWSAVPKTMTMPLLRTRADSLGNQASPYDSDDDGAADADGGSKESDHGPVEVDKEEVRRYQELKKKVLQCQELPLSMRLKHLSAMKTNGRYSALVKYMRKSFDNLTEDEFFDHLTVVREFNGGTLTSMPVPFLLRLIGDLALARNSRKDKDDKAAFQAKVTDECSICLSLLIEDRTTTLQRCGHIFHTGWLQCIKDTLVSGRLSTTSDNFFFKVVSGIGSGQNAIAPFAEISLSSKKTSLPWDETASVCHGHGVRDKDAVANPCNRHSDASVKYSFVQNKLY